MRAVKSPTGFIKKAVSYIVSLVFPESCIFCLRPVERNSPNPYVCRECLEDIPYLPFDERLKEKDGVSFEDYEIYGLSIYDYRSIRDTIFLFKYKGFKRYGAVLGRMMADYVIENKLEAILDADMVVPVPPVSYTHLITVGQKLFKNIVSRYNHAYSHIRHFFGA